MAIRIDCSCGRTFNVPERKAGQKVACLYCGKHAEIPETAEDLPALEAEDGTSPVAAKAPEEALGSDDEPIPIQRGASPFPPAAMVLGILSIADAVLIVGISGLVVIGSLFASAVGKQMAAEEEAYERFGETADAFIFKVKSSGGNILLNENAKGPRAGVYRRIRYTTAEGTLKEELLYLGEEPDRPVSSGLGTSSQEVKRAASLVFGISVALILTSLAKVIGGIGFFLRRNWGRVGVIWGCGIECVVGSFGVVLAGASFLVLPGLLLNVFVIYFFRRDDAQGAAPY